MLAEKIDKILIFLIFGTSWYGCLFVAGDNIPPLPRAQPYSTINATALVDNCRDIDPTNRSPPMYNGQVATAHIEFAVDRFIDIDDVLENVGVTGALYIRWEVTTCQATTTLPDYVGTTPERVMANNPDSVWHPGIAFRNSVDDIAMQSDLYSQRLEILFNPTTPNRTLHFYWKRRGIFRAVCSLDLSKFPFDTQECPFEFYLVEGMNLIKLVDIIFQPLLEENMSPIDGWEYVKYRTQLNETSPDGDDVVSQATYFLTFKRKPYYFISNLLAPCIVLSVLELAAFLIPPTESDRVCFSVYLLLAFAVGQSQVLGTIPKTPQYVLLNYFIQLLAVACGLCTLHAILMFWFVSFFPKTAEKNLPCCFNIRVRSLVDMIAFVLFIGLFAAITIFCLSVGGLL